MGLMAEGEEEEELIAGEGEGEELLEEEGEKRVNLEQQVAWLIAEEGEVEQTAEQEEVGQGVGLTAGVPSSFVPVFLCSF